MSYFDFMRFVEDLHRAFEEEAYETYPEAYNEGARQAFIHLKRQALIKKLVELVEEE